MITFLIEDDVHDEVTPNFVYAAQELGHTVKLTKYIPFGGTVFDILEDVKGPLVFFGSLNFIRKYQEEGLPHKPFAWCDWTLFECHTYFAWYGPHLIHTRYGFYPLKEVERLKDQLYEMYGVKNKIFVKPDTNDKIFSGEVVAECQFDYWHRIALTYQPSMTQLCLVSTPTQLETEWRFIVAKGKVVAGSQYRSGGMFMPEAGYKAAAAEFAEAVAAVWQPHPVFVVDVCETRAGDMKLVEIGPVNGAGLYKCDIRAVVQAMADVCEET